jgi:hypothetical protein
MSISAERPAIWTAQVPARSADRIWRIAGHLAGAIFSAAVWILIIQSFVN